MKRIEHIYSKNETYALDDQITLLTRGVAELIDEAGLRNKIQISLATGEPLNIKLGVDPTAPDIHLGHTVVFRKLKQFQDLGHKIKFQKSWIWKT